MLQLLELIDKLTLLVTYLKYYDCYLIKSKDLLVIIMGSDNKIR